MKVPANEMTIRWNSKLEKVYAVEMTSWWKKQANTKKLMKWQVDETKWKFDEMTIWLNSNLTKVIANESTIWQSPKLVK